MPNTDQIHKPVECYSDEELKAHYAHLAELNAAWVSDRDNLGDEYANRNYATRSAQAARAGKLLAGMPETPVDVVPPGRLALCPCKICVQARAADVDTALHLNGQAQSSRESLSDQMTRGMRQGLASGLRKAAAPNVPDYDAILAARDDEREFLAGLCEKADALEREFAKDVEEQGAAQTLGRAMSLDQHDRDFAVKARLGQR